MEDLSLHILDIVENSIDAGAGLVEIDLTEESTTDRFAITIKDNGRGMTPETIKKVMDPFFSTKTVRAKKFGLGIPFFAQAAEECNGKFFITSKEGKGTVISAEFQNSHIDRKPLGDMGSTMMVLISGHPEIDYLFTYRKDGFSYIFDTIELKKELNDVPINLPDVLKLIKDDINEALREAL